MWTSINMHSLLTVIQSLYYINDEKNSAKWTIICQYTPSFKKHYPCAFTANVAYHIINWISSLVTTQLPNHVLPPYQNTCRGLSSNFLTKKPTTSIRERRGYHLSCHLITKYQYKSIKYGTGQKWRPENIDIYGHT